MESTLPSEDVPAGIEPDVNIEISEKIDDKENDDGSDKGDSDEDSDDDVNVVIGDIKTSPTYTALNIKRTGLITASSGIDKLKQTGKFSIDEFESVGSINGIPAQEYNLDSLEDKPWRKPGADITDYFNYGFNEDTWRAYCERQKRMRVHESGVGLAPMNSIGLPRAPTSITNDNSKYSGNFTGPRKAGPPPGRRMTGSIDVIGGNSGLASRRGLDNTAAVKSAPPKENVIQVMTADRREYSRKPAGFPDMSVPPPGASFDAGDMSMPPPGFETPYQGDFFNPEPEPYYGGYEPTQDLQWGTSTHDNWAPTEIKELTPGPVVPPPVVGANMGPPPMVPPPTIFPPVAQDIPPQEDSISREESPMRDSRSRSEKPDRHRERSHRRERSRSRSRRHKSRSRSPSHRSHRKKKSRRHDKDESD